MSAEKNSPKGFQIPQRHVIINDNSQLPIDYSSTPGGTLFSTTPGGTRIVYERSFLMNLRNSPLSRTPPKNLPNIPGITLKGAEDKLLPKPLDNGTKEVSPHKPALIENLDEPQFTMEV